jgi:multiple sugar transport system permease protein
MTTQAEPAVHERTETPAGAATEAAPIGRRRRMEGWLFVIPAFAFQLLWGWYPMIVAFFLSMTDARARGSLTFTGLQSYQRLLADPLVEQAFRVTFIYAGLTILLTFVIPILVAILLMEMPPRWMRIMMLLWFLPLSTIASTVFWRYMYNRQFGVFQFAATDVLGLPPQPFLNSSEQVLFWLVFPGILFFGPGLIYMATLQSIPASYYEAAEVEGAGFWRKIWTVSLPRLRPIIALTLLFAIINSMQAFEFPDLMTGGGPNGASRTVVLYLVRLLSNLRYADATALAVMLFLVIMAVVIVMRMFIKEDPDA